MYTSFFIILRIVLTAVKSLWISTESDYFQRSGAAPEANEAV